MLVSLRSMYRFDIMAQNWIKNTFPLTNFYSFILYIRHLLGAGVFSCDKPLRLMRLATLPHSLPLFSHRLQLHVPCCTSKHTPPQDLGTCSFHILWASYSNSHMCPFLHSQLCLNSTFPGHFHYNSDPINLIHFLLWNLLPLDLLLHIWEVCCLLFWGFTSALSPLQGQGYCLLRHWFPVLSCWLSAWLTDWLINNCCISKETLQEVTCGSVWSVFWEMSELSNFLNQISTFIRKSGLA
jgi:hypothetical protein